MKITGKKNKVNKTQIFGAVAISDFQKSVLV